MARSATVCWRLTAGDPDIASVRYRALIPARHLGRLGIGSRFSWGADDPLKPRPDAIVFVKALADSDVRHAERAAMAGVRVLVDVCDNVFADGYREDAGRHLRYMAATADALVTTGDVLAGVLADELGKPVEVVPDPLETADELAAASRAIWRQRLSRARRDGLSELAVTAGYGARRALRLPSARMAPESGRPQVVWFGNAGSTKPRFGIANLVDIAEELRAAAEDVPLKLLVVTSDRAAFEAQIAPLGLDARFAAWDGASMYRHLRNSRVAVLPNSRDPFSICKSANRAVLALSQGVPVVATRVPALEVLGNCVVFDDFRSGVTAYLRDGELVARHVACAEQIIEREFAGPVVARRWRAALAAG